MLNVASLKLIAEENDTAKAIFNRLADKKRSRSRINIRALKYEMLTNGQKVVEEEFLNTFKKLMDLGVGSLVVGRAGNPTRFIWNYKLKDVAMAAKSDKVAPVKTIRRPRKLESVPAIVPVQKVTMSPIKDKTPISITFNLSPDIRGEDLAALISLAKELEGK